MTVDEAIARALVIREAGNDRELALVTLAEEVRRLRAAVEAVKMMPAWGRETRDPFRWLLVHDDVLAILEPKS